MMNYNERQVVAEKIGSTVRVLELLGLDYHVGPPRQVRSNGNASPRVVTVKLGADDTLSVYNGTSGSTWAVDSRGKPLPGIRSIEDLYAYLRALPSSTRERTTRAKGDACDAAEVKRAVQALTKRGSRRTAVNSGCEPGVYAIHLNTPGMLKPVVEAGSTLLYIGMSSNLAAREFDTHFSSGHTGFSTVRRSIGAILKNQLALVARPRGRGRSAADYVNFCFESDGEERLTSWMLKNLSVRTWPTTECQRLEKVLIDSLRPPLNLVRGNPKNAEVRALRKVCADEARRNRRGPAA